MQTVKRALRKILRKSSVNYDELLTIITEVEGIINCRPLCYLHTDDTDEILTPSHLMVGRRLLSRDRVYLDEPPKETEKSMNKRLKYLTELIQNYHKRWTHEYLTELREHQRCHNKLPAKQAQIGDIVLIQEDLPRSRWRMGKIEELIRSKDGQIRACKLRVYTKNKKVAYINRPVTKLCYFEVSGIPDRK